VDEEFNAKVEDITGLYISAIEHDQNRERTISIDEMTGIQATERLEKDLLMRPGKVARKEFEYIRHGTQSLIASFDVATGQIVEPTCGDTRTEWLNQIEIWFSILVRKLLKRASFLSQDDLKNRILNFIDYFNQTMAKPFKWTYKGKVLAI
jgi:hypothetical protein